MRVAPSLSALVRGVSFPREAYEMAGLTFLWIGIASFVYLAAIDSRGLLRRSVAAYERSLDVQLRSVFSKTSGGTVVWAQLATALALATAYAFVQKGAFAWGAAATLIAPPLVVRLRVLRRRRTLDGQVHGFALALANGLKTTASIGDAVWVTVGITTKPLREELDVALKQVRIGSTLDDALLAMSERAQCRALDVVVSALLIGRQTGGDLPRILEGTASSLREMKRLEELTDRVTASSKQSLLISAAITAGLAIVVPQVLPGFFDPLRDTLKGQLIAIQCVVAYVFALYLGYRFTRTDV